jgi:3-oxosteroid 1-dehydrogenase
MTHHDMFASGGAANMAKWNYGLMSERLTKDERCLGAGLAAYFVKGVLDRGIPMHTGVNAQELIGGGGPQGVQGLPRRSGGCARNV